MTNLDSPQHFGITPDGQVTEIVEITCGDLTANILSWGASLQSLYLEGTSHSLVLGSSDFRAYLGSMSYFGAIVGPVANRIADGTAWLKGEVFRFDRNENGHLTLHSGYHGLAQKNWEFISIEENRCCLQAQHLDGTGGFPGNLVIEAEYSLSDNGILALEISATTDQVAFCNLAHHSYWNLDGRPTLDRHKLQIFAEHMLPVDGSNLPTGEICAVQNTRFDFLEPRPIWTNGEVHLDHNFCLNAAAGQLKPACRLETCDLELYVSTTDVGLQVYDGYGISTYTDLGLGRMPYGPMAGVALEPQGWPDAPNNMNFPSIVIKPNKPYTQRSEFRISRR